MTENARRGTKRVVVEMELVEEEYIERSGNEAFSELKTRLALPRLGMPMYAEVGWGGGRGNKLASTPSIIKCERGCTAFFLAGRAEETPHT